MTGKQCVTTVSDTAKGGLHSLLNYVRIVTARLNNEQLYQRHQGSIYQAVKEMEYYLE